MGQAHATPEALAALTPGAARIEALWSLSCDARPLPPDSSWCTPVWADALAHVLATAVDADECTVALTAVTRIMRSSGRGDARTAALCEALMGVAERAGGDCLVLDTLARALAAFVNTDECACAALVRERLARVIVGIAHARGRAPGVARDCAEALANAVRAAAAAGGAYPCEEYAHALEVLSECASAHTHAPLTAALAAMCKGAQARARPVPWLSTRLRAYLAASIEWVSRPAPGLVYDVATPAENAILAVFTAMHTPGARADDWPVLSLRRAVWRTRGRLLLDSVLWRMMGEIIKCLDDGDEPSKRADDDADAAAVVLRAVSGQGIVATAAAAAWTCSRCASTFVGCAVPLTSTCAMLPAGCGRVMCDACLARRDAPQPTCGGCGAPRAYTSCAPLLRALAGARVRCPYCYEHHRASHMYWHLRGMRCRRDPPPSPRSIAPVPAGACPRVRSHR